MQSTKDNPAIKASEANLLELIGELARPADNPVLLSKFGIRSSEFEPFIRPDAEATIIDMPCGSGKSTMMIENLALANRPQLIVVPLISEVLRVICAFLMIVTTVSYPL